MEMRPYVVRQGEHLAGIAARYGFDPQPVWEHEANSELREQRRDPQILAPGDLLYIPIEEQPEPARISPNTNNRYQATQPRVELRMALAAGDTILANEPYRVEGLARPIEGTTDGEGRLREALPPSTRSVRVVLPNRDDFALDVRLGNLNPHDGRSGQAQRLRNLGLDPSLRGIDPVAPLMRREELAVRLADATRAFQRLEGADETGDPDDVSDSLDARHHES